MNPNKGHFSAEAEPSKPMPMAFTINFSEEKNISSPKVVRDNLAKYSRHVRNASLPNVDEAKKPLKNGTNTIQAVCMSPLTSRKGILNKRLGYHSEGYFSSDQEDDLRAKSDIFVRKLRTIDKGIRTTNLAQEKKIMSEQCSRSKLVGGGECHPLDNFREACCNGKRDFRDENDDNPPNPPVGSPETLGRAVHVGHWLEPRVIDDEGDNLPEYADHVDESGDLDDLLNDSSNDTVSEAGTYTIERDNPCSEVMRARQDLENVILKIGQMQTLGEDERAVDDESEFKRSVYSDGSNWINEWASQVAKHNQHGDYEKLNMQGLPPIPIGKQQGPTPVSTSKIASPVHERRVTPLPTGRHVTPPPQRTGQRNLHSTLSHVTTHETGNSASDVNGERHSDSSLETESFLRATESVVSAMQARMSVALDSSGESDVDTSHSYRGGGAEKLREKPVPSAAGERLLLVAAAGAAARRASNASDRSSVGGGGGGGGRLELRAAQSDSSSSEAGAEQGQSKGQGGKTTTMMKKKNKNNEPLPAAATAAATPPPAMRYNRAFSLRRARLDCEQEPPAVDKRQKSSITEAHTVVTSKPKKITDTSKVTSQQILKAKSPKPEAFSRTDSGRFSMRATKPTAQSVQTSKHTSVKKETKRSAGGRSNSTLSSREVEFQNWKRRKSYDPMKAAAEGKKKEAAKKASMSTSMTQASIADPDSPSHQNPVLRSASFHGTGGMTPNYVSSEEELTLSADEDSPISACPPSLVMSSSPAKVNDYELQAILEGAFGGSRTSLHSMASNSSVGRRAKLEAIDNLVMAAVCGLSNKLRGHSCKLLKKLRYLYEEDAERAEKLSDVIDLLETTAHPDSPQSSSPSKELSATLKNLKRIETVFRVLDDVLFDEEDFEQEMDVYQ